MAGRIVVVGSSNIDFIMKMNRLPRVGETIADAEFMQTFGGKGANQALAAGRAGGQVSFINCVGDDPFAPIMLRTMQESGVDVSSVEVVPGMMSGTALVMIGEGGHNYLSISPGANYEVTVARLEKQARLLSDAAMILLQYEIPVESLCWLIDFANDRHVPVMWNFAPARDFDPTYPAKVQYLAINETEASVLTGIEVSGTQGAQAAATELVRRGCSTIIVTLGAAGTMVTTADEVFHLPGFPVRAIDSTAAGDCHCGSLAVALVEGKPLREAVRFANAAAAISVTRLGAQPSLPYRAEIDAFVRSGGDETGQH